jgi:hypothetical protein
MAAISNLYIDAGSLFSVIITVRNSDQSLMNLNGYTVAAQIRKSYGSTTAYNFNASVFDPLSGKIRLQLPADQSSLIKPGRYLYDIEITSTNNPGQKVRVVEGLVIITPEITKV